MAIRPWRAARLGRAVLLLVVFVVAGCDDGAFTMGDCVSYSSSDFTGQDLSGEVFSCSQLGDAVFVDADLTGADFRGVADIGRPDFTRANLTGANFEGGDFSNGVFDEAVWAGTICPDGTNSDDNSDGCIGHLVPAAD